MGYRSGECGVYIQSFHTGIVTDKLGCQRLASEPVLRILLIRTDGGVRPSLVL